MRTRTKLLVLLLVVAIVLVELANCAKSKSKMSKKKRQYYKQMQELRKKETNPVKFIQLVVMRLIYGVASGLGFEDRIAEVGNGALVPPGAEDDYGLFDDDGFGDDY